MPGRKALLLRVGIDRGTGGALAPIFEDGSFEYIPVPETEPTRCSLTFANLPARRGQSLAAFVPARIADRRAHIDPDFTTFTYGDAAEHKRGQLLHLEPGDLLVFYAGLEPWPKQDIPRLFAIGWFEVNEAYSLTAQQIAADRTLPQRFGNTAHFLRDPPDPKLALIEGEKRRSRFLERAVPLGDGEDRLLPDLIAFGYRGSLRRAVGHWLHGPAVTALEDWLHRGPTSLIDDATRIFTVAAIKLYPASAGRQGALVIDDARPAIGDWVFARDGGAFALARINARAETGEAFASLFWYMPPLTPAMRDRIPVPDPRSLPKPGAPVVRRLVSWMAFHYRIGIHAG
jgi:putative DNA base modification enzyme with NMAD domain